MTLPSDCSFPLKEGFKVHLPKMAYTRGATLDMIQILARSFKSKNGIGKSGGSFVLDFREC